MKIKYLGSGAAECIPALFCNCDVCRKSRELGGKNIRSNAQALLDDFLLFDFGPATQDNFLKYCLSTEQVDTCIVTHDHFDHFNAGFFESAMFSHNFTKPFDIYVPEPCYKLFLHEYNDIIGPGRIDKQIHVHLVKENQEFIIKDRYQIHTYAAHHDVGALIYSIKDLKDNKQMLYANDTGYLSEASFDELKKVGGHYDLLSLDCTDAKSDIAITHTHMTMKITEMFIEKMRELNLIDDNTLIVYTHFSHNGGATHDELVRDYQKGNRYISFDGFEIKF